jgi:cyclic pyranopterin phosphate synthase
MPQDGVELLPRHAILTRKEIVAIVSQAAELGIHSVRLTGGEPLVRPDLVALVQAIAQIPGIEDLSMTTNGMLLAEYANELVTAGLTRVNVSLDTLQPDRFQALTRCGDLERVLRGIKAADEVGLTPIKINTVVVHGLNDGALEDLARLTINHPWHVRFIELMPLGNRANWGTNLPDPSDAYVSVQEIFARLAPLKLIPIVEPFGSGPSRCFRIPGGLGTVGMITPLGDPFCGSCNRLRLTADGRLRPCLMSEAEFPLRQALRAGRDVRPIIQQAVAAKPRGHTLTKATSGVASSKAMVQIGG